MTDEPVVTVLVARELIDGMQGDWSPPVQVRIVETPGIGTGWELIARRIYDLDEQVRSE